jgi:putative transposase
MPQSLAQIYLHIVFSTKNRRPFLDDSGLREQMHRYLNGIAQGVGCPLLAVGGVADHVHLLCRMSRTITVADLLRNLKRDSSIWFKAIEGSAKDFEWQSGYGAFSISPGHVAAVTHYLESQESHHATVTFQDEFRRLLQKYEVEFDERFVWD